MATRSSSRRTAAEEGVRPGRGPQGTGPSSPVAGSLTRKRRRALMRWLLGTHVWERGSRQRAGAVLQAQQLGGEAAHQNAGSMRGRAMNRWPVVSQRIHSAFHPQIHPRLAGPLQGPGRLAEPTATAQRSGCARRARVGPAPRLPTPAITGGSAAPPRHEMDIGRRAGRPGPPPGADQALGISRISTAATGGDDGWDCPSHRAATAKGLHPLRGSPWGKPAGPTWPAWWARPAGLQKGLPLSTRTGCRRASSSARFARPGSPPASAARSVRHRVGEEAARQRMPLPHISRLRCHRHEVSHAQFAALLRRGAGRARITPSPPTPKRRSQIRCTSPDCLSPRVLFAWATSRPSSKRKNPIAPRSVFD